MRLADEIEIKSFFEYWYIVCDHCDSEWGAEHVSELRPVFLIAHNQDETEIFSKLGFEGVEIEVREMDDITGYEMVYFCGTCPNCKISPGGCLDVYEFLTGLRA